MKRKPVRTGKYCGACKASIVHLLTNDDIYLTPSGKFLDVKTWQCTNCHSSHTTRKIQELKNNA